MKIYMWKMPDSSRKASAWFNNTGNQLALRDLEAALAECEQAWGECRVFVECTFPRHRSERSRQTDLVIAFRDRAALCEIKQGRLDGARLQDLDDVASQIQRQLDLLRAHFMDAGLADKSLFAFLWLPQHDKLSLDRIITLIRHNNAWPHITLAGAQSELRSINLHSGAPSYLAEVVPGRLKLWQGHHTKDVDVGALLVDTLKQSRDHFKTGLLAFADFKSLHAYLRRSLPQYVQLMPEPTDVPGLRVDGLREGLKKLGSARLVQVVGPSGVGKSTFIKELLTEHLSDLQPQTFDIVSCVLEDKRTVRDIVACIAAATGLLSEADIQRLDEDALLAALRDQDHIYWIKDYDQDSRVAVSSLIQRLKSTARRHSAYWVIESMIGSMDTLDVTDDQLALHPLADRDISAILLKHVPGSAATDLNGVISASGGIPRLAVWRWSLRNPDQLPTSGKLEPYDLFMYDLHPDERPLVVVIAYILSRAPLGTTFRLIEEWYADAFRGVSREVARARTRHVIAKAANLGLVSTEMFGSRRMGTYSLFDDPDAARQVPEAQVTAFLRSLIADTIDDAEVGWVQVQDPHFVEYYVGALRDEEQIAWRTQLEETLVRGAEDDLSLTGVTFSLLNGEFAPFVRSSFRSSSAALPRLQRWLDTAREFRAPVPDANLSCFREWLTYLLGHYWDTTPYEAGERCNGAATFRPREPNTPFEALLVDTLLARGQTYWRGGDYDWEAWKTAAEAFANRGEWDLWAETLVRQAQARLRPPYDDPEGAWQMLRLVLDANAKLTLQAGRAMLYFHVLSFLNKRKLWQGRVPGLDKEAPVLVPHLAASMIRCGIAMENINTIANALFFWSRSVEVATRPTTLDEVLSYTAIMRLVQRVSPARRIQALLTEGSLHRHYSSRDAVQQDEFREHADEALEIYTRAFSSARRAGMATHVMNALVYKGVLLVKGLRFAPNNEMRTWVELRAQETLAQVRTFMSPTMQAEMAGARGTLERDLWFNLQKYRALLRWIVAMRVDHDERDGFREELSQLCLALARRSQAVSRVVKLKMYQQVIGDLRRVLSSAKDDANYREMLLAVKEQLFGVLGAILRLLPADPGRRTRTELYTQVRKLVQLFTDAHIALPQDLASVFVRSSETQPLPQM